MSVDRTTDVGEAMEDHRLAGASASRERILTAAEHLFAGSGFDATSTARIAREAGIPKGLLFYYFPAKADVLSALLNERLSGRRIDAAALAVPGDPVAGLLNVAEHTLAAHEASDVLREILWHESHTRDEVHRALTAYRHALHAAVVEVLHVGLGDDAPAQAVHAVAAAWAATITARPLAAPDDGRHGDLHEPATLRPIAQVLCAGLQATAEHEPA